MRNECPPSPLTEKEARKFRDILKFSEMSAPGSVNKYGTYFYSMRIGCARVSAKEIRAQIDALTRAGVDASHNEKRSARVCAGGASINLSEIANSAHCESLPEHIAPIRRLAARGIRRV